MVELLENTIIEDGRRSSKGNQLKWKQNGYWYKADYTGYEGLAEYVVSHLLARSSLTNDEFVMYDLEQIKYKNVMYNGAISPDFLGKGYQLITLERLIKNTFGLSLNEVIYSTKNHQDRLFIIEDYVKRATGIPDFCSYLQKMLAIDALFLNEDRHTHNIAILTDSKGHFSLSPFFDHGGCLLSDTTVDYPLGQDVFKLIPMVKAKTFCTSLEEQLEIAEKSYGDNIMFFFDKKDVITLIDAVETYSEEIRDRVRDVIFYQMDKYSYLFRH